MFVDKKTLPFGLRLKTQLEQVTVSLQNQQKLLEMKERENRSNNPDTGMPIEPDKSEGPIPFLGLELDSKAQEVMQTPPGEAGPTADLVAVMEVEKHAGKGSCFRSLARYLMQRTFLRRLLICPQW